MSQQTLNLPVTGVLSGLALVNYINDALSRLSSLSSGNTDPATLPGGVAPFSLWLDTASDPDALKMRNAANTAWCVVGTINGNNFVPDLQSGDIINALGFTPANKAGQVFMGDIKAPVVTASTKYVFPDGSEQTTAAQSEFASGTKLLFWQSAAPTGWTKSTAHNDKALRVVSGSVSSGGSVAFSTAFASRSLSIDGTTLSISQMPSHDHPWSGTTGALSSVGSNYGTATGYGYRGYSSTYGRFPEGLTAVSGNVAPQGSSQSHAHSGSLNMAVQYVDVILATKD